MMQINNKSESDLMDYYAAVALTEDAIIITNCLLEVAVAVYDSDTTHSDIFWQRNSRHISIWFRPKVLWYQGRKL